MNPIAKMAAGPIHFAHSGWAFVDIHPDSNPVADPSFYIRYDHPYSFESQAWLDAGSEARFPVCIMNAGYSSGWCEESFGLSLVAIEVQCRAMGHARCRLIMSPPDRLGEHVERYRGNSPDSAGYPQGGDLPEFFRRKRMEDELRRDRDLKLRVGIHLVETDAQGGGAKSERSILNTSRSMVRLTRASGRRSKKPMQRRQRPSASRSQDSGSPLIASVGTWMART